jgi:methylated-DNA-[protein]-cysteine S-methyltransferase
MAQISLETRFGVLCITEEDGAICRVTWGHARHPDETVVLRRAGEQLRAYDAGETESFDLPLVVRGSHLVQAVCAEMSEIPFGETRTYGDLATKVGASAQAVGQACGQNPIPVIIPCHRVMGSGGKLTGYSGGRGVETKIALLRHERAAGLLI